MQPEAMVTTLRSLKLFGMAQALAELAQQGGPAFQTARNVLGDLLKAETAEREVRSIAYQMKIARFPAYRDLAGFDFGQSVANEALVRQLHCCEFLEQAHNVVLVGGPGTGKTHLASAFGVQALQHHRRRVRFFSTVELVNTLELEKTCGNPRIVMRGTLPRCGCYVHVNRRAHVPTMASTARWTRSAQEERVKQQTRTRICLEAVSKTVVLG